MPYYWVDKSLNSVTSVDQSPLVIISHLALFINYTLSEEQNDGLNDQT